MKSNILIFRGLAWFASIYHIILGLIGTFASSGMVVDVASRVYGVTPTVNPQFLYLSKFIAAYMIVYGVMMALLALKPYEYRRLVIPAVLLFAVRIFDRFVYFDLLNEAFGSTMSRNMMTVIPIAIVALGLIYFRPKSNS